MLPYIIIGILMIFVVAVIAYFAGYSAGYNENREELEKLRHEKNRKRFQLSFTDLKNERLDFPNSHSENK